MSLPAQKKCSLPQLDAHLEVHGLVDRLPALQQVMESLEVSLGSALILGEQGIGKTALLECALAYLEEQPSPYWVVSLASNKALHSPLGLLQALVLGWQQAAQQRLAKGLEDANSLLEPLGLRWQQEELIRAVTLMRLQWDMDQLGSSVDMLPRQRLANAIRSAMPFSKRVHFSSVNLGVKQLVERLTDPWLTVAVQWVQPVVPEIVDALALITPLPPKKLPLSLQESTGEDTEEPYLSVEKPLDEPDESLRSSDDALAVVVAALQWVNGQLKPLQQGHPLLGPHTRCPVVVAIDSLEFLALLPVAQRQAVQKVLQSLMAQSNHHWWLSCNSESLSQAMAGPLLKQCGTLVTLEPLSQRQQRRWLAQQLSQHHFSWEEDALERLASLTQGNPFWLSTASHVVVERLRSTATPCCSLPWVVSLGIDEPNDWLETAWARVLMTLQPLHDTLNEGEQWNPLQDVADALEYTESFYEGARWTEADWLLMAVGPDSTKRRLAIGVMASLVQFGFVTSEEILAQGVMNYRWSTTTHRRFLMEKTRWVRADLPNDARLAYLQKIIPLSAQAGELDGPRVGELLILGAHSMSEDDLQALRQALEDALVKASQHLHPTQRLMALDGLARLASPQALEVLQGAFKDGDATVREYALRYWVALFKSSPSLTVPIDGSLTFLTVLTPCLDDTEPRVRWWAYKLASHIPFSYGMGPLVATFLKGAFDQSSSVRRLAVQSLGEADAHSAQVRQTLMTLAQTDPEESIRYEACKSLQRQPHPKVLETFLGVLEHDASSRNRSLVVQLLSQYQDPLIAETFRNALASGGEAFSEEVRLTLIRALRMFPGESTETALQALFTTPTLSPELSWVIIRTFHEIAQTPETLTLLKAYFTNTSDATLKMACLSASQSVLDRLNQQKSGAVEKQSITKTAIRV
ncbi:MAG: hypothetical protein QE263_03590 [Vampirovibrionales bacterium]|nr:hypothetical protein [Vampirovibrionales bacterium]